MTYKWISAAALAGAIAFSSLSAQAETYVEEPTHFSITFDVDHLGFSQYVMRFNESKATLTIDKDAPEKARVEATIMVDSYDSNNEVLKKKVLEEALDGAKYPQITFKTVNVKLVDDKTAEIVGNLTIRDVTKPVSLVAKLNGMGPTPGGGPDRIGFSALGKFKRSDFGINTWVPFVGDEVNVRIEAEFVKAE